MVTDVRSADGFRLAPFELIVYTIISFIVVVCYYWKWKRRHFDRVAAKLRGPPSYPIVGSGLEFIGTPEQVYQKLIKLIDDYGPNPFKVWMGSSLVVCIAKPKDIEIVLKSSMSLEKGQFYKFFKNTLGEGLLAAPVHKWKKHRRIIAPVFNANLLEQFLPLFNEKTEILINNLKEKVGTTETFDLWDYIAPTTLDTICQTAMGYNLDSQSNRDSEFGQAWIKTSEMDSMRIYKPWLYPEFIFKMYTKLTGLDKMYEILQNLPNRVIKERKESYTKKKLSNGNNVTSAGVVFLDKLLELNEIGANFSDTEIKDEVLAMMVAGGDINAVTLCHCFLMLAIYQDIQYKVYEEIYQVFGDGDEIITTEKTSKLVYMEQVIKETLRLYPSIPLFLRHLQDDVKISTDGLVLPKGTTCFIGPLCTHHSSYLYPDPWEFNPEHFSAENVAKRHKYSFLAFSAGPRDCVGSKYAMMFMKVVVSTFLRNYSVHTNVKHTDIKSKIDVLIRSAIGYPVTIRPRYRKPTYNRI